ncbi:alpha-hydroxy acid oxidase [Bradyrhizobium sp. DASA03007]|uniref:alpha-hydroxy acid oxidase n=1 Tax=unclassified Bradyrhizobium TaxID=2631580 RepID=UPI003F70880D
MNDFLNYNELRRLAKHRLPRGIFEYIDRGSEDETALLRNRQALDEVRVRPRILTGSGVRSQAVSLFGETHDTPIIVAPTAFAGLVWYQGEIELAKAAASYRIPFCAATEAITAVEEIAAASTGPIWLQLYLWEREELWRDLLQRAWDNGVRTLVVTVDSGSVAANREYNTRNGFGMPFNFSARNVCDVALHPRWAFGVLARYLATGQVPAFANYPPAYRSSIFRTKNLRYEPNFGWDHIHQLRELWKGNLVLKGILRADDAILAAKLGADGIVVSNHGGRNLDSAVAPIEVLAEIVDAIGGKIAVIADSGIQRGSDILKLLAVGARAVMLGRTLLYGTAVGGMAGASQMIGILRRELDVAMAQTGCKTIGELDRSLLEMPEPRHHCSASIGSSASRNGPTKPSAAHPVQKAQ